MPVPEIHTPREATIVVSASDSVSPSGDYFCDGTADDVEINAALTAAAGGTVLLLEGTYNTIASITIPSNTTLRGQGKNRTIIKGSGAGTHYQVVVNADTAGGNTRILIQDLTIDGNWASGADNLGGALHLSKCTYSTISRVEIENGHCHNVELTRCLDIVVENCESHDSQQDDAFSVSDGQYAVPGGAVGVSESRRIKFTDCHAYDMAGNGFEVDDGPQDIHFVNCSAEIAAHDTSTGFEVHVHAGEVAPQHIVWDTCYVLNCNMNASCEVDVGNYLNTRDIRAVNCTVEGAEIRMRGVNEPKIIGCTIIDAPAYGILACGLPGTNATYTMQRAIIQGNNVIRIGGAAAILVYDCIGVTIDSNGLYQGTTNHGSGIMVGWLGDADKVTISSNIIDSAVYGFDRAIYLNAGAVTITNVLIYGNQYLLVGSFITTAGTPDYIEADKCCESFMDIQAVTANYVVAAEDISGGGDITCTLAAQPDVKRNLTLTVTDGDTSITEFTITVTGVDAKGKVVTEVWVFAGGLTQTGNVAFATVTSVVITDLAGAGVGDTVDVGIGSKLGLANKIYVVGDVYKTTRTTGGAPAATAGDYSRQGTDITVNATYDTVDMATGAGIVAGDCYAINYRHNLNVVA